MPETCENSLGRVNNYVCYVRQTREIYQVLPYSMDVRAPVSKTVLSKCSFIWNNGLINIWNDRTGQK